jgi:hypothetical protein
MRAAIARGDYNAAADEIMHSHLPPSRAQELAQMMRNAGAQQP